MKRLLIILVVLNIAAVGLLTVIYYFGFDLQWGVTSTALTWGLPLAIGALFTLTAGLFALKKKSIRWGIGGLGAAVIALIYYAIVIFLFSYLLLPPDDMIEQNGTPSEQNNIMALVLSDRFNNGGYTVVNPVTRIHDVEFDRVYTQLNKQNNNFTYLLDTLFELNRKPVRLNLISKPREGYFVDYHGVFARYFEKGGGNWLRWQLFHPQVAGYTQVSLPAYDPQSGYVLIYIQHTRNSRYFGGSGNIIAYKYENGKLTTIEIVPISIQ